MRHAIWLLIISACLMLSAGCDPIQPPWKKVAPAGAPQLQEPTLTPGAMVETALASRANFSRMHARASMKIRDVKEDFGLSVNTEIIAGLNPDRLRIRATKASVEAFDVVIVGEDIAFYVKRKRTLYRGTLADLLKQDKISFRPDEVLTHLLQPEIHLAARRWRLLTERRHIGRVRALVLEEIREDARWRIVLDPHSYLLLVVEQLDAVGEVVFAKTYGRYRELLVPVEGQPSATVWYPFSMRLSWPVEERSMEIRFRDIDPIEPLREEEFELAIPDRTRTKPINRIRIDGEKGPH